MKKKILLLITAMIIVKAEAQTSVFKQIDSLLQFGRYKIALNQLKEIEPSFNSNLKIALVYDAIDDYKQASLYYQKALSFKDDYLTRIKLAKSLKKEGKLNEAIVLYEAIDSKDSDNLLAKYQLGKLYLQTKKSNKAKKVFESLIEKDPSNANYSYQLGLAFAQLKKRNPKINRFLDAFRKDSTHFKAIEMLARAFTKLRDKDSANIFIEKGLHINPNHIDLNKLKINSFFRKKKYEESIVLLKHLDSLSPNEYYTQKMLAKSYYNLKDLEKAKKHFSKATKLDREDFKSYTYLGHIAFQEKNFNEAMYMYKMGTFVGKEPRDEEYMGLAKVYYEMELPKRVIENYKKAVAENFKNREALFELAKFSKDYYKDKKIGLELYKKYIDRFEGEDEKVDEYVKQRINTIKKDFFLKGEIIE
ncbi:tetratricopeptide repeat protein [Tenacibaculum sp. IB213877]|uniref:tetratricopeptide repeat protein n=1 Tax=Tenacibaculum sp. IB213877 TaxID=3097351 RepID=UPI002A59E706|nr:tetratricopeptide repeat protein [Tenacibaculum sp. IB213877]MDY0780689.1 tetratricopeptide repeat protein [Tenacibaculum sp. IB213877]